MAWNTWITQRFHPVSGYLAAFNKKLLRASRSCFTKNSKKPEREAWSGVFFLIVWGFLIPSKVESVVCSETFSQALGSRGWVWTQLSTERRSLQGQWWSLVQTLSSKQRELGAAGLLQDLPSFLRAHPAIWRNLSGLFCLQSIWMRWESLSRDFAAFGGASCCCPLALQKVMAAPQGQAL